ncbi:MAG: hypothetical protein WA902_14125, partial [Thermosynechococcaceae cyanobacterium]
LLMALFVSPEFISSASQVALEPFTLTALVTTLTTALSGLFASSFTTRCVVQDEARSWLRSIPVSSRTLIKSKLIAIFSRIWISLAPMIALILYLGGSVLVTLFLALVAPISQVLLRLWNTPPSQGTYRDDLLQLLEGLSILLWTACGCLFSLSWWPYGILVLVLELGLMRFLYQRCRKLGASLIPY